MIQIFLCLSSVLFAYRGKFNSVTLLCEAFNENYLEIEAVVEVITASSLLFAVLRVHA